MAFFAEFVVVGMAIQAGVLEAHFKFAAVWGDEGSVAVTNDLDFPLMEDFHVVLSM